MEALDAQQLKDELGNRAKDIIANGLNLVENREKKVICPLHSEKTPSMSWYKEGYLWNCFGCKGNIDIYRYYTEFENMTFPEAVKKVGDILGKEVVAKPIKAKKSSFVLPECTLKDLSNQAIEYMATRKITKETLDHWEVKQTYWGGKENFVFQYFNENNVREFITFREIKKGGRKGGCLGDTKAILWGMWHIDKTKPLVITEGQPDAMAVWQSGYKNVVSVPMGANNFKWVDYNWDWLQGIPEFIVWADNDDGEGMAMANNIKMKLTNVKIIQSENRKDANEVLFYDGVEKVVQLIQDAINLKPKGLVDLSEVSYKSESEKQYSGIETGFYEYDSYVEDWKLGEITVILGRNGEGKTTFISQIMAHLLEKKVKTFLYSGEMSEMKIQEWLYRQIVGANENYLISVKGKYKTKLVPKPEVLIKIKQWHKNTLYLYDRNEKEVLGDLDKFFEVMKVASKRFGVKLFVIDNLMAILEENADSLYSDQANFVQRCRFFVNDYDAHIVLLTHPNKEKKEIKKGSVANLEKTDISGSYNISNKADNIIAVERLWDDDRDCDAVITSLKDRTVGQRKQIKYWFDMKTLRFYNNITPRAKDYSWDKKEEEKEAFEEFNFTEKPEDCPF